MGTPLFRAIERELLAPNQLADTVAQDRRDWRGVVPGLMEPDAVKVFHHKWSMTDGQPVYAAQAEYRRRRADFDVTRSREVVACPL